MTHYILDTDHISLQQRSHPAVLQRLQTLRETDSIAVTIITVEEQIRGRLEIIRRHATSPLQVPAYSAFQQTLRYFAPWQILDFTREAFEQFSVLRQQRIRIGTQDLRIAAITLTHAAILVTRNRRDFAQVSGLVIEDWSTR
ncbi:MAG: type II toxin-antitoxin system VapC family toxin [Candidatus Viridilinea halotolerans]|uniref:Type II toxin-antitoxin system VapC family toxin n=1 Tax=Candidatus Viridilinea halotolerans TaxID=2491704 RepID=A0A426TZT7_9CHLR|nr:MAG: type II toxin-antitoxin system VapC family toxin [Candidatus Viridilinea halotolerans]